MRHASWAIALAVALAGGSTVASAEVVSVATDSFELKTELTIAAPLDTVWATLGAPQTWWDKDHTYSGDSANLYLDRQATGCLCERLPGKGSVEHARIVFSQPPRVLRLVGGLGPLQREAVTATLTFTLEPDGDGTRATLEYVVGGYMRGGGETLAPAVDQVLVHQLDLMKAAAEATAARPAE
ncbi:SRPBCC family protein [Hephaestia sp. GCM10023244]|uniref:SRPBCC family protein n=1 Tax=unclassified Hephaestia TaxID=2631281 RepID=UPI002076EBB2|nr:SRPBCC family protein [Hephaestia sp. MAHUQ-44]MCM8730817.1 SRPBCC family protein [Hephaestia sp. MAHUQ-44]